MARLRRKGYSYAVPDALACGAPAQPDDDGVWVIDLERGSEHLAVSWATLCSRTGHPDRLAGQFVWSDSLYCNSDGTRLMALLRHERRDGFTTDLFTFGRAGEDLRLALPFATWAHARITHQLWGRSPDEILIDADFRGLGNEFTVFADQPGPPCFRVLCPGVIARGHQSFSPDGRLVMSDSYPVSGWQYLKVVEVATGRERAVAQQAHPPRPGPASEWRCDLHPRWRPDSRALSFDSIHDGWRRIWVATLD